MPTTTIPALPAVTKVNRADIVYVSQAGVSSHATVHDVLNCNAGEGMGFLYNGGPALVGFTTGGGAWMEALAGQVATINGPVGSNVSITGVGAVQVVGGTGQTVSLSQLGGPGSISWNAAGHISIVDTTPQTPLITYATGNVAWWGMMAGAPLTINDAINRIAAQVNVLGGPIP